MQQALSILMAQINPTVGAITLNTETITTIIQKQQLKTDVIVFPELALSGYPPEDLLMCQDFQKAIVCALHTIQKKSQDCYVIIGHPAWEKGDCYNALSIFNQGEKIASYYKQHLPNYGVFDEKRYFQPGPAKPCTLVVKGHTLGLCICEDIWQPGPVEQSIHEKVTTLLCLNASPFDWDKYNARVALLSRYAKQGLNILYVNQVGGQDELVFDGQSLAFDKKGTLCVRGPIFSESLIPVTIQDGLLTGDISPLYASKEALLYNALQCGLKDYVKKNGFKGVLLGLSGGIDSALTLALAHDALGAQNVHAVLMPSRYTAEMSNEDALEQLRNLGVPYSVLPIEPTFNVYLDTLAPVFQGYKQDITEENLQARIRGTLLMALSNKSGKMLLSTSNKSETAVGYTTLYGDMAGGFAVLKDVLKTQVYALAHFRNKVSPIIPERVLKRAPSAELAPNQTDQDSLPDYVILDAIIQGFMEKNLSSEALIRQGFDKETVFMVIKRIMQNEYKRRQAAPGVKISPRAFGKDWRQPITKGPLLTTKLDSQ